jgi:hypothetical protein
MELYPTISSDIRFTNMLGQPGEILFSPNFCSYSSSGPKGKVVVLGEGCLILCLFYKQKVIAALWLELAFDFFSFFIRINCT